MIDDAFQRADAAVAEYEEEKGKTGYSRSFLVALTLSAAATAGFFIYNQFIKADEAINGGAINLAFSKS